MLILKLESQQQKNAAVANCVARKAFAARARKRSKDCRIRPQRFSLSRAAEAELSAFQTKSRSAQHVAVPASSLFVRNRQVRSAASTY